jgi:protein O-GlcNAc transferase
LGNIYYALGDYEKALQMYKRAFDINPNYPEALANIALVLRETGRCEEAIPYYDKLLTLFPDNAEAMIDKGICLKELGKYEEAEKLYREAAKISEKLKPLALYNLACLYNVRSKKEEAKKLLEESFKLDPSLKEYAKTDPEVKDLIQQNLPNSD